MSTLCAVGAMTVPTFAGAAVSNVSINGSASPVPTSLTTFSGVSLSFGFDATYSGGFNPVASGIVFHFDNDIGFDTTGLPQCAPGSIAGFTTAQALVSCGAAKVGSGNAILNGGGGTLTGVVTVFNGTPNGGNPTVLFHLDINNGAATIVSVGTLRPSSRGGDFGTEIDSVWPPTGVPTTHLAVTLDNLEPAPGHHYVSARCSDLDRVLNFATDFTYFDSSTRSALTTQSCPPTGERAKALKKCKKKQSKTARRKCRMRAHGLPV